MASEEPTSLPSPKRFHSWTAPVLAVIALGVLALVTLVAVVERRRSQQPRSGVLTRQFVDGSPRGGKELEIVVTESEVAFDGLLSSWPPISTNERLLPKPGENEAALVEPNGITKRFGSDGRLIALAKGDRDHVYLSYDLAGKLVQVEATAGDTRTIWDAQDR